jgi:hypothetical protein
VHRIDRLLRANIKFVITWPAVLGLGYLGALVIGLTLCVTARRQPSRRIVRIATAVLTAPILLGLTFFVFLRLTIFKEPPTLADLQRDFQSKRADLEAILRMSDEDVNFSRIAPDFVDRTPDKPNEFDRFTKGDPRAALPESRWDAYRRVYVRSGIKLGIQRDASRDAFITVDSVGLLNRGHVSGYLHCAPTAPADAHRYYPCMLHEDKGMRNYDPKTRREGYSFQRLDDRWFTYDEGPS